jgi:hypothetical protein
MGRSLNTRRCISPWASISFNHWTGIGTDEDLEMLHGDPEFEAIVTEVDLRNRG